MHYTDKNFKTKKALKDAVALRINSNFKEGYPVTVFNPESFSGEAPTPQNGTVAVGGPHYPAAHIWYASVTIKNGEVIKVK